MARTRLKEAWRTDSNGQRAVDFISRLKLIGDYTGEPFVLRPWQEEPIRRLFGTVTPKSTRQYTEAFWFLPRKQSKTQTSAAIAAFCLYGEARRKQGQEIYSVAATAQQAQRVFKALSEMIRQDQYLLNLAEISDYHKRIYIPSLNNTYAALSGEAGGSKHSLSPSIVLADELHVWRGRELWNAITSGFGGRKEPLLLVTTTAGSNLHSLCYEQYAYAKKVQNGEIVNPSYLPVIYEADPTDDWTDEKTWHKAMPALGDFCNLDFIRKRFEVAKEIKSEEIVFRRYYMNNWMETTENWLDLDRWDECLGEPGEDPEWFGGLDMSTTGDVSAFVLVGKQEGKFHIKPFFWVPRDTAAAREKQERLPYAQWSRAGHVELTDGDAVDYAYVGKRIEEICHDHQCGKIAIDDWNTTHTAQDLQTKAGIEVVRHRKGTRSMTGPSRLFEWLILKGDVVQDGNPLMREMVKNVGIKMDEYENIAPIKPKTHQRIDGVVAAIYALSIATSEPEETGSLYDTPGSLWL